MKIIKIMMVGIFCHFYSFGAYLTNVPITLTQPDGAKIECYATGDEYYNWTHDKDGYTIVQDQKTGYYCYAALKGEDLVASIYVVGRVSPKSVNLKPHLNISGKAILKKANAIIQSMPQKACLRQQAAPMAAALTTGTINNIVVYIRFADQSEFFPGQILNDMMFNSILPAANSMRNYFREVTYGKLKVISHFYPTSNGTTILSYQDSHSRNYYCPYSTTNPSGYTDSERVSREHMLLYNAVNYIRNQIPTSLNVDSDNDGYVDNVCFIVRGGTTDWNTLLWPHKWSLSNNISINGKRVWDYNFQLEDYLSSHGNGVLCHEMGHSLGIPDLYHGDFVNNPVGIWDLMSFNTNPPQHISAYMKHKYGGWIPSIPTITKSGTYTLQPLVSSANNCYKIPIKGSSQYLVVEYRKKIGIFDYSLPGSGLIVYRINDKLYGNFNATEAGGVSDEVYVFRRDGSISSNGYVSDAYFLESSDRTTFSSNTNPFCFTAPNGMNCGKLSIKNIIENSNGTLSFDVCFCVNNNATYSNTSNLPILTNASNIQTLGMVIVKSTDNITFEAEKEVVLNPGFEVQLGGRFEINMDGCSNPK